MNHLGILLAWSALQTTLLALAATTAYLIAARRMPALGAAVAAVGPCGAVLLTMLAMCPLPSWWNWQPPSTGRPATPEATLADLPRDAELSSPGAENVTPTLHPSDSAGLAWPVAWGRWTWEGAGRASAPFADQSGIGWEIAAIVFLTGASLCGFRLTFGLWAVADLRRRSRRVADSSICLLMDQLQCEMGYRRRVEVRESSSVGAPAVVGWLRPLVLLPEDWRDWSEAECRAVLAHELAHIRRADYLLGLLARLGVALHFYHPLLHWLAGRLRLQQELAADALAAPFAGGRAPYLLALAGLALRLEDRRSAGWPANPMFSRGTLMRRIHMLKIKDGRFTKPIPRWGRALIVALLAVAVVGVSALRCPAQKEDAKPPGEIVKGDVKSSNEAAAPAAEVEPFDLPYISPDAMGVVAFRPSAVLGRRGLKKYADEANKGIVAACKMYGMSRAFSLPIEQIAQVSMTFRIHTNKDAKGGQSSLICGVPVQFRAVNDFDWAAEIKTLFPGVQEVQHGDRVYRLPGEGPLAPMFGNPKICFHVVDSRTVVFDTEEHIDRQVERPFAALAREADFKRVERGVAALVLDNRNGAWGKELAARDNPVEAIVPFHQHTSWIMAGISADKDFVCDAIAHFDGEETAGKAEKAIKKGLAAARDALASPEAFQAVLEAKSADADSIKNAMLTEFPFFKALVHEPELQREGTTVHLRCRAKCDITEVLGAILEGKIGL